MLVITKGHNALKKFELFFVEHYKGNCYVEFLKRDDNIVIAYIHFGG